MEKITPNELSNSITLASRKRRIAAFIIDHFTLTFLMVATVIMMDNPMQENYEGMERLQMIMLMVMLPGFLLYFGKDCIKGMSLGKWIMGIKVRNEISGDTPSPVKLFARNLTIIIWPIEAIILAVSPDKKRLGDKLVKTCVTRNTPKQMRNFRILAVAMLAVTYFVFMIFWVGSSMKDSAAYKTAVTQIESNQAIIESTGGIVGYGYFPAGNINITNNYGTADFQIKVKGKTDDVTVSVLLEKLPEGEWKIKDFQYE